MLSIQLLNRISNLTKEQYLIFAGPNWPAFEDIISFKNIPQIVLDELIKIFTHKIRYVEFYITNVCNYNCSDCRSFNNFDFTGHYEFRQDLYQPWTNLIDPDSYTILGGEPLLHPNFKDWVEGLRKLWPNAWAKIDSNGSYITKVKNLHQILLENEYFLCINIHNPSKYTEILQDINSAFSECEEISCTDPRIYFNKFISSTGHYINTGTWLITKLGLPIQLRPAWNFTKTLTGQTNWNDLSSIYVGNATNSHNACNSKLCHVMLEGKLYKCSTMATLPIFLSQKNIKWPDELLYQYQPLTVDNFSKELENSFYDPIPQCAFCPCETEFVDISNSNIKRKKNIIKLTPI